MPRLRSDPTKFLLAYCHYAPKKILGSLLLLVSASVFSAPLYDNLIVFGDSLSDTGNNTWVVDDGKQGAPLTSEDPRTHRAWLWPNFLVEKSTFIGANPNGTHFIYPERETKLKAYSPYRYSTNYAYASAETGDHYVNDLLLHRQGIRYLYHDQACLSSGPGYFGPDNACVPGLLLQVKAYLQSVNEHPNPKTLFILWSGGNDLFNNMLKIADKNNGDPRWLLLCKMFEAVFPLNHAYLSNPVENIKLAVDMLMAAGVKPQQIEVIGLPDLAKTPAAIAMTSGNKPALFVFSTISALFNVALRLDLAFSYWQSYRLPNDHILSSFDFMNLLLQDPRKYALIKTQQSCVADHATPYCEGYLFFNAKHPTTQVNRLFAAYLLTLIFPDQ